MKHLRTILVAAGIALSAGTAAADRDPACERDPYVARCEAAKALYRSTCLVPATIELDDEKVPPALIARLEQVEEAARVWAELRREFPRCTASSCSVAGAEHLRCTGLPAEFRAAWADFVRVMIEPRIKRARELVAESRARPLSPFGARELAQIEQRLTAARALARFAFLGADVAALDAALAEIAAGRGAIASARKEALDKVTCPAATRKDAALTRKLRDVLVRHSAAIRDPGSTMVETIKRFHLRGSSRMVRELRVTHEDAPAVACVQQVKGDQTTCRILDYTFRRTKPDGGRWGAWAVRSVGGGGEMACKNLR